MFCSCTLPETFLCGNCVGPHNTKWSGSPHTTYTLDQLAHYKGSGYSEWIQRRLEQFPKVRAQMLEQVSTVDRVIQEFGELMDRSIGELTNNRNKTVEKLQKMNVKLSRKVDIALAEVERTIVEDNPLLTSKYASMVRALTEKMYPFELFSYSLTPLPHIKPLRYQVHSPQIPNDIFTALFRDQLAIYDLKTQETTQRTLAVNLDSPGYIALDRETLMLVGFTVMTLDLHSFQLTSLPNLHTLRNRPGLAKVESAVYAFGGWNSSELIVCEKWSMQQWSKLGSMHYARSAFTPCFFQSLIYLAGTRATNHRAVESFSPYTEMFTVLPISLPSQLTLGCVF